MRDISPALQAHLQTDATTLCHCWQLTRADGAVLGFTDHDRPLAMGGVFHAPNSGFTASAAEESFGFSAEAGEVVGALSQSAITALDIERGLYDGAQVATYKVNWAAPEQHALLRVQTIGEIAREGDVFRVELRGLRDELNRVRGRLFQKGCDAVLGDRQCTVDLSQAAFHATVVVAASDGNQGVTLNDLSGFAPDWFSGGLLRFTSGALQGLKFHVQSQQGNVLTLERPVLADVGDQAVLTAGCDKRFESCQLKFSNTLNFQGFPHMPGDDFALSYPVQGGQNDGSMLG